MNRIVRENYPVADLPADLREQIEARTVKLTIEADRQGSVSLKDLAEAERARRLERGPGSCDDPVSRIREDRDRRDGWHDRIRSGEG